MNVHAVPGLICAFGFDEAGHGRRLPEEEISWPLAEGEWLWLHLNFADWRCRRWLSQSFDFPVELANEICDPALRQHVSAWEGVLYGHLADFRREFDADSTEFAWLHFALGEQFLITGRVKAVQSAERLRQVIGAGFVFASPADLLSHLLSLYTDALDMALHRLSDELEMIEDHVLDEHHRGERKRLMLTRREIAQLHRHMRAMRRALQTAERASIPTPEGFADTTARLVNLDQDFADMELRARFFSRRDRRQAGRRDQPPALHPLGPHRRLPAAGPGRRHVRDECRRPSFHRFALGLLGGSGALRVVLRCGDPLSQADGPRLILAHCHIAVMLLKQLRPVRSKCHRRDR